jgi:hypothetical protein
LVCFFPLLVPGIIVCFFCWPIFFISQSTQLREPHLDVSCFPPLTPSDLLLLWFLAFAVYLALFFQFPLLRLFNNFPSTTLALTVWLLWSSYSAGFVMSYCIGPGRSFLVAFVFSSCTLFFVLVGSHLFGWILHSFNNFLPTTFVFVPALSWGRVHTSPCIESFGLCFFLRLLRPALL